MLTAGTLLGLISAMAAPPAAAGPSTTTAPSTTTTVAPSTTAAPPPYDLTTIEADQQQAIRLQYAGVVGPAAAALSQAQNGLDAAEQTLSADQRTSTNAAGAASAAALVLRRDLATKQRADAANARALATLHRDRNGLVAIGVQLYVGTPTTPRVETLPQIEEAGIAQEFERTAIDQITGRVRKDQGAQTATQRAADAAGVQLEAAATALNNTQQTAQRAADALGPDTQAVRQTQAAVEAATAAYDAAARPLNAALAAFTTPSKPTGTPTPSGAGGPKTDATPTLSILGPSALDAAQLAAWFNASGFVDLTSTPIEKLAAWYLSEGKREGVRGDVAFAQSIVETGGFSSRDAMNLNNYAGIGHCDSCANGGKFPSAQLGIRAQMQLLRTYATPGLTAAALPDPPVTPLVTPQSDINRGCCPQWTGLTGHWATSTTYGPEILNVYQRILAYTVSAPTQPAGTLTTP